MVVHALFELKVFIPERMSLKIKTDTLGAAFKEDLWC